MGKRNNCSSSGSRPAPCRKLNQWSETSMIAAVVAADEQYINSKYSSKLEALGNSVIGLKKLATKFKIPRATLRRVWLRDERENVKSQVGRKTVLSSTQEETLCRLIIERQERGFPITVDKARQLVYSFCELNNISHRFNVRNKRAGWDWWSGFRKRNPDIVLRTTENLSRSRALGMERERISTYYEELETVLNKFEVKNVPERLYNVDESGVQIVPEKSKVLARKGAKAVHAVTSAERGATTTVVCSCSASGHFIPPMIIFKGTRKPTNVTGLPIGTLVETSKSGWIDKVLFVKWFHHFLANMPPRKENEKVVLIMDSHYSHDSVELFQLAAENNIELVGLPSHTTNYTQPLDVALFGPFKRSWKQRCRNFMDNNPGRIITREVFGEIFTAAYRALAKESSAVAGFRKTGLCPFDVKAIPEHAYRIAEGILGNQLSETTSVCSSNQPVPCVGVDNRFVPSPSSGYVPISNSASEPLSISFASMEDTYAVDSDIETASVNETSTAYASRGNYTPCSSIESCPSSSNATNTPSMIDGVTGKTYTMLSNCASSVQMSPATSLCEASSVQMSPATSLCEASFSSLLIPLNTNCDEARASMQRFRKPNVHINRAKTAKTTTTREIDISDSDTSTARPTTKQGKVQWICGPCGINYESDCTGTEWLQCMECKVWQHDSCGGKSTKGVFFCKACVAEVLKLLKD